MIEEIEFSYFHQDMCCWCIYLNTKRKKVGEESDVTLSFEKQMTSSNVWTLHPGVREPVLCRTGHNLHMSKNLDIQEAIRGETKF